MALLQPHGSTQSKESLGSVGIADPKFMLPISRQLLNTQDWEGPSYVTQTCIQT